MIYLVFAIATMILVVKRYQAITKPIYDTFQESNRNNWDGIEGPSEPVKKGWVLSVGVLAGIIWPPFLLGIIAYEGMRFFRNFINLKI